MARVLEQAARLVATNAESIRRREPALKNWLAAVSSDRYQRAMEEDGREFIHRIDAGDRIVFANGHWYDFARENGVTALNPDAVVGRPLWDFIENPETQQLFQLLLGKIRRTGIVAAFRFRCDAPDRRRFMGMSVIPQPDHAIEFRSRILRQEMRDPVRLMLEDVERTGEWLKMCSWCKKLVLPDGRWVEVEEAVVALHLFNAPRLPQISHGICGECSAALLKSLD